LIRGGNVGDAHAGKGEKEKKNRFEGELWQTIFIGEKKRSVLWERIAKKTGLA